ncbi:YcjF family protein [Nodosilinea sp. P-1105]|uniref:YcjF family protein n=1 Tax=Nodosilinea sp. P-1105 TaxID=2546229 RepID=UPI00146B8594|nr:YcjF family protein [Nodosilinea sp. P-1105]NMF86055.1 DUF697 domain-containing protein [Nodosilinea sp. P-1105]
MALKRPILVGGLGLSATLWLLETVHFNIFDSSTLLSAMAVGSGIWWWRGRDRPAAPPRPIAPPVVDRTRVIEQLQGVSQLIAALAAKTTNHSTGLSLADGVLEDYRQRCQQLHQALDRQSLKIAVVGDASTGKSTLIRLLATTREAQTDESLPDSNLPNVTFREVSLSPQPPRVPEPALEHTSERTASTARSAPPILADDDTLIDDDALLLVTDGDITASCFELLKTRVLTGQGAIVVFNKADHYDGADQHTIISQLRQRVDTLPVPVPVVQTIAAPRPIKVRRHQANGTIQESMETVAPHLDPLHTALEATIAATSTLVAATTLRQTESLRQQVQTTLNQRRRQQAMPLIEQLQWVAAATAFVNPVPTLDVLAAVAINGQLIMDLGKIYGFNLSLDEAKTAAGNLASLTVKLGLVELSTQLLTAVLKTHFATYVAGGMVQGMSAAYLTRMAGLSLVDYFEQAALAGTETTALSWSAIADRLQTVIQQNRQVSLVRRLVSQGIDILKPSPATTTALEPTTAAPVMVTPDNPAVPLAVEVPTPSEQEPRAAPTYLKNEKGK